MGFHFLQQINTKFWRHLPDEPKVINFFFIIPCICLLIRKIQFLFFGLFFRCHGLNGSGNFTQGALQRMFFFLFLSGAAGNKEKQCQCQKQQNSESSYNCPLRWCDCISAFRFIFWNQLINSEHFITCRKSCTDFCRLLQLLLCIYWFVTIQISPCSDKQVYIFNQFFRKIRTFYLQFVQNDRLFKTIL